MNGQDFNDAVAEVLSALLCCGAGEFDDEISVIRFVRFA
jgi:hypothetical protein